MKYHKIVDARVAAAVHLPEVLITLTKAEYEPRNYIRREYLSDTRVGLVEILKALDAAIEEERQPNAETDKVDLRIIKSLEAPARFDQS